MHLSRSHFSTLFNIFLRLNAPTQKVDCQFHRFFKRSVRNVCVKVWNVSCFRRLYCNSFSNKGLFTRTVFIPFLVSFSLHFSLRFLGSTGSNAGTKKATKMQGMGTGPILSEKRWVINSLIKRSKKRYVYTVLNPYLHISLQITMPWCKSNQCKSLLFRNSVHM